METKGGVLPDFDLEIDDSIVFINSTTYLGQFTITVTNVAVDATIRVRITIDAPGMMVSPEDATISVGPASSRTVNAAIAATYSSPARIGGVHVFAEITHVNGVPFGGVKERDVSAAVILLRNHNITPSYTNITLGQGETKSEGVLVNNSGNAIDYIALEFMNNDDQVQAYPQVDYLRVEAGQLIEYPVIVTASEKASKDIHTIPYHVYSLADSASEEEGELNILVVDEKTTVEEDRIGTDGRVMMGILVVVMILSLMVLSLLPGQQNRRYPSQMVASMVILLLLGLIPGSAAGFSGDVTVGDGGSVDPSPITQDQLAITTHWITLSSNDETEQVVEISVDSPFAINSYNRFQRISPMGSTSFPIHTIVPKESAFSNHLVSVEVRTVEREGVEVEDGSSVTAGYSVLAQAYSLPLIEPLGDTFFEGGKGDKATLGFRVVNGGNARDSLNVSIDVSQGDGDSIDHDFMNGGEEVEIGAYFQEEVRVKITDSIDDVQVLRFYVSGNMTTEPVAGGTILILPETEDEEKWELENPAFIGGAIAVVVIIGAVFVVWSRKRKAVSDDDDEDEGLTMDDDERMTMDDYKGDDQG